MCGIAGFTAFRTLPGDSSGVISLMTDALAPRGPDGKGYHQAPPIVLGHRRLSIIDPEGGAQPMVSTDGRYVLVCNGELYNYIELRRQWEACGHRFRTQSDTEVLLRQLMDHPVESLSVLNGMYAFALWDRERKELLLARDRLGIKPLYYSLLPGDIVFASELKALLLHPGIQKRIHLPAINKYFAYGYIPTPATIYQDIYKLEPGHYLLFGPDGMTKAAYWDLPAPQAFETKTTPEEAAADVRDRLRRAVKMQLRSDVPVGVFLSGGIDSSTVTALAAQESAQALHTFSVGFEESSYDETPYALEVARRYNTLHHHEVFSGQRAAEMLPQALGILDEPFGDASILPTFFLSRFTRQTVQVALGGDGGDELFAGYPAFQAHFLMEHFSRLPPTWQNRLIRLARCLPVSHRYTSAEYLLNLFFKGAAVSPETRFSLWMGCCGNEDRQRLFSPALRQTLCEDDPFADIGSYIQQSNQSDVFARLQYLCMKLYLQDDLLVKMDRASMAHGLEVRVPFLDHTLVEFAMRLPRQLKLNGRTTKVVLKQAVRDLLPARIIRRRKAGFMIPLAAWLTTSLRPLVDELCSPQSLSGDNFFDPAMVRQMLAEHHSGRRDHRKTIWSLVAFQFWRKQHGP